MRGPNEFRGEVQMSKSENKIRIKERDHCEGQRSETNRRVKIRSQGYSEDH